MSTLWHFNQAPRSQWFRAPWLHIALEKPNQPPTLSAAIHEVQQMPDTRLIDTPVGDLSICLTDLSPEDQAKAAEVMAFLTDLLGRYAEPMIQDYLAKLQAGG